MDTFILAVLENLLSPTWAAMGNEHLPNPYVNGSKQHEVFKKACENRYWARRRAALR